MNAKCPKCGTVHTNLNFDVTYKCSNCEATFNLVKPTTQPVAESGDGFWLLCKLASIGISIYVLYLISTL